MVRLVRVRNSLLLGDFSRPLCPCLLGVERGRASYVHDPGDLLQIDPPQRSLGDIKADSVTPVSYNLSNRSSRPIRVLGAERFCTKWGCIRPAGLPVTVPPHSSREVQLMLKAARAGDHEFSTVLNLYLDCPANQRCRYDPRPGL